MLTEYSTAYKPFQYEWAVSIAREHESIHWTEDEVDLSQDISDWNKGVLSPVEINHITQILKLFTHSDFVVGYNYYDFLIPQFKNNEIRMMLGSFAARESTHVRAYALLNDTLGLHEREYYAFLDYQAMSDKVDFMSSNDISTPEGLGLSLAKSVFNEGVSLFASFAMLLNYKRCVQTDNGLTRGKMPGMCTVVEWSQKDEDVHIAGNSQLFRTFCNENPQIKTDTFKKSVYEMARQVAMLEDKFIDLAYELGEVVGLTKDELKLYVRYLIDRRLIQLGFKGNFNVRSNPLPWIDMLVNGNNHTNFFEKRVTDYRKTGMTGDWGWSKTTS